MRTDQERLIFCGTIMDAARRMGIWIAYFTHNGDHRYIWQDNSVGVIIECQIAKSQQLAFELACDALVNYFCQNNQTTQMA